MNIINQLPKHFIEHEYFNEMLSYLDKKIFNKFKIVITCSGGKLPVIGSDVIVIRTGGNERGEPPKYIGDVGFVFQNQLKPEHDNIKNLFHIPLPYPSGFSGDNSIPILERKYDVVFIGRVKNNRKKMWDNAIKFQENNPDKVCKFINTGRTFSIISDSAMCMNEYSYYMKNAKIALNPTGNVRCECIRHTEATKCGSAIISCMHPLEMRLWKNSPAIFLNDWDKLEKTIKSVTCGHLLKINNSIIKYYNEFISPKAVADYITASIRRI